MSSNLTKTTHELAPGLPLKLYLVWDIRQERWHQPPKVGHRLLSRGVWVCSEDAWLAAPEHFDVVVLDLAEKIPQDLHRVQKLCDGSQSALAMKLRQLIKVFVFGNSEMSESLREKWRERHEEIIRSTKASLQINGEHLHKLDK